MIYQDRLETNLLQLFASTYSSEWFSIISVICFEVSIVSEHVNTKRMPVLGALLHGTQANSIELVVVENRGHLPLNINLRLRTKIFKKTLTETS